MCTGKPRDSIMTKMSMHMSMQMSIVIYLSIHISMHISIHMSIHMPIHSVYTHVYTVFVGKLWDFDSTMMAPPYPAHLGKRHLGFMDRAVDKYTCLFAHLCMMYLHRHWALSTLLETTDESATAERHAEAIRVLTQCSMHNQTIKAVVALAASWDELTPGTCLYNTALPLCI